MTYEQELGAVALEQLWAASVMSDVKALRLGKGREVVVKARPDAGGWGGYLFGRSACGRRGRVAGVGLADAASGPFASAEILWHGRVGEDVAGRMAADPPQTDLVLASLVQRLG